MKITKCVECGAEVARVVTKKGNKVLCDVYWDGEYKVYEKNRQPLAHNCPFVHKRRKKQ